MVAVSDVTCVDDSQALYGASGCTNWQGTLLTDPPALYRIFIEPPASLGQYTQWMYSRAMPRTVNLREAEAGSATRADCEATPALVTESTTNGEVAEHCGAVQEQINATTPANGDTMGVADSDENPITRVRVQVDARLPVLGVPVWRVARPTERVVRVSCCPAKRKRVIGPWWVYAWRKMKHAWGAVRHGQRDGGAHAWLLNGEIVPSNGGGVQGGATSMAIGSGCSDGTQPNDCMFPIDSGT